MSGTTALLPFQPAEMSPAQLAAISYLARYSGHTRRLYAFQLRRWFNWYNTGWTPCKGFNALTSSSTSASSATRA